MPDNDFNTLKPVESLHNVGGLNPVNQKQEKKRRQTAKHNNRSGDNPIVNGSQQTKNDSADGSDDNHSIDYKA